MRAILLRGSAERRRQLLPNATYDAVEQKLLELSTKLLAFAQADSGYFGAYMQALRLPKGTPSEETARKRALLQAVVKAIEAALDILDLGMMYSILRTKFSSA
jgi:formiminotetrahydrofolate cyclodeaminase